VMGNGTIQPRAQKGTEAATTSFSAANDPTTWSAYNKYAPSHLQAALDIPSPMVLPT
jgi:hypothetical protein